MTDFFSLNLFFFSQEKCVCVCMYWEEWMMCLIDTVKHLPDNVSSLVQINVLINSLGLKKMEMKS